MPPIVGERCVHGCPRQSVVYCHLRHIALHGTQVRHKRPHGDPISLDASGIYARVVGILLNVAWL